MANFGDQLDIEDELDNDEDERGVDFEPDEELLDAIDDDEDEDDDFGHGIFDDEDEEDEEDEDIDDLDDEELTEDIDGRRGMA